ncbi:MAG: hypothetical protein ABEJ69_03905 [Candidatus Nanohaloarchaea archaeon]
MDTLEEIKDRLSEEPETVTVLRAFLGDEDQRLEYDRLENYLKDIPGTVDEDEIRSTVHTLQANRLLSLEDSAVETYSLTGIGEAYLEELYGDDLEELRGNMLFYFDTRNI